MVSGYGSDLPGVTVPPVRWVTMRRWGEERGLVRIFTGQRGRVIVLIVIEVACILMTRLQMPDQTLHDVLAELLWVNLRMYRTPSALHL